MSGICFFMRQEKRKSIARNVKLMLILILLLLQMLLIRSVIKIKLDPLGFCTDQKKKVKEDFVKVALSTAFHNFACFRKTK